jgi:2-polyprenyl-6-methoxyphenol hydroxylase-like FAD-dependent oxidoreductase
MSGRAAALGQEVNTGCCVVGGGPAGMMLGFLLARAGVDVIVFEKHKDFLRDFRGDTIHPSTLEVMHELGLLEDFLKLPHQEVRHLTGQVGDERLTIADFGHLPTRCRFIALMPQWDFLNFLAVRGERYPGFHLRMQAEVTDLVAEQDRIVGVRGNSPDGAFECRAALVVGADGRTSVVRERAGLKVEDLGAPMDVFWMRLSRRPEDGFETLGRIDIGRLFVMLNRGDYWQCALVIPKGSAEEIRRKGLAAFRETIAELAPFSRDRLHELAVNFQEVVHSVLTGNADVA